MGMSGGVDSSVAAALLVAQGYEVVGVYIEAYNEPGCRTDQDKKDALKVALQLGISFQVLDLRTEYKDKVIEYFYREYELGRTPNPDIVCNREIKFGIFLDWAVANGFDKVATGHYARIANGLLQRARDIAKDQSYFLWQVTPDKLEHVLFPLGEMLKSEVRTKAKELNLPTASKPDSMGICFVGEVDVAQLLRKKLGENPGEIVMQCQSDTVSHDVVVGEHKGLWFYTVGERKGLTLDKKVLKKMGLHPESMAPMYVVAKDASKNRLVVGPKEATMTSRVSVKWRFLTEKEGKLFVRIRNLGELYEVVKIEGEVVTTKDAMMGVAEGQSAVVYLRNGAEGDEVVVGGGEIFT